MVEPIQKEKISRCCADWLIKGMCFPINLVSSKKPLRRLILLETFTPVPGLIGGSIQHLKGLLHQNYNKKSVETLFKEAENERMQILTLVQIGRLGKASRFFIVSAQLSFSFLYLMLYLISRKTAHHFAESLEEQGINSYNCYLQHIEEGKVKNILAPKTAARYWNLPPRTHLRELILAMRADEIKYRSINKRFSR